MLSTIQPSVSEVAGVVLAAPKPFSFLKIKSATGGGGGARRALAALGPNNAKFNMDMAKSQLANTQDVFSNRWNFNPLKEVPLAQGRYQWTPLFGGNDNDITPSHSGVVAKDIAKPIIETAQNPLIPKVTDLNKPSQVVQDSKCTVANSISGQENSEINVKTEIKMKEQVISPKNETTAVPMKNVTSTSQNCITDFFRPQKCKSVYIHDACIPYPNTPPKKKARLSISIRNNA